MRHHTWVGHRVIQDMPAMPFARCACGWEGPSRLRRCDAVQDGWDHEAEPQAS